MDAKAKAARNKKWEEAFAHLQEALDSSEQDAKAKEEGEESVRGQPTQATDATSHPDAQTFPWSVNTGRGLVRYYLPPQSLWAPEKMRLNAMRRRHTWKKLAMQDLSISLLIHDLIKHVNLVRFSHSALGSLKVLSPHIVKIISFTEHEMQLARHELLNYMDLLHVTNVESSASDIAKARARSNQPGIPRYSQDADGDFHLICKQMNNGIQQLLGQQADSRGNDREKAITVAKICHNLLVSTAAPNLETFKLLLSGFAIWRFRSLADDVITAFLRSKIRPDELACRLILEHYTGHFLPQDFSRFVAKMRGAHGALMLAKPTIRVNEASQGRLVRDDRREDKIYQKVYATPMVFAALIHGVMRFAGFDRALDIYYEMKVDGWGLDVSALTKLLEDCARRADWEGGMYVWEEISSIRRQASRKDMTKAYYHMISLCSITGNTVAFNQVLNEIVKQGLDRRAILLAAMKITRWTQNKKVWNAPAFAADNLMIAISDYADETKMTEQATEQQLSDSMAADDGLLMEPLVEEKPVSQMGRDVGASHEDAPVDSAEAWPLWVEHEFGKKPKH